MANRTIEQLIPVSHLEVEPMYSKEELLDKLAYAVKYMRDEPSNGQQKLELELMYSIAKAFLK